MSSDAYLKLYKDCQILLEFVRKLNRIGLYGRYSVKGNILLHYLQYSRFKDIDIDKVRYTKDIDIAIKDFNNTEIRELIVSAFKDVKIDGESAVELVIKKEPGEIRTAWQVQLYKSIYNGKRLQKLFKIDVNGKGFIDDDVTVYRLEGEEFYGSTIEKILADKLSAISSNRIENRTKDIYDVSILMNFDYDIYEVAKKVFANEHYEEFQFFDTNKELLINKMKRLPVNKEFDAEELYNIVYELSGIIKALRGPITGVWGELK